MPRLIATDIVSPFHFASVVAASELVRAKRVQVTVSANIRGRHVARTGNYELEGLRLCVRHSCDWHWANWALLPLKFILFMSRRVWDPKGATLYLAHHTYFKPTLLNHIGVLECIRTRFIAFEEGTGTYGGRRHHIVAANAYGLRFPRTKYVGRRILSSRLFVDRRLSFLYGNDAQAFQQGLETVGHLLYMDELERVRRLVVADHGPIALILGSPHVESGTMSRDDYLDAIAGVIAECSGMRIFVKQHPLEVDSSLYDATEGPTLPKNLPAELIFQVLGDARVYGFDSGALLTAEHVFRLPTVRLPAPSASSSMSDRKSSGC